MIRVEENEENVIADVKGEVATVLTELAYLIHSLKENGVSKEFIMASVKTGLEKIDEEENK